MPRRGRIIIPGIPVHLIQRGNNRQACFFVDEDYQIYLDWLREYAHETKCLVHAFCLMTNHVHILLTPAAESNVGNLMKRLGQRYVQYVNRTYKRSGTLWEGRFRSCIAQEEQYLLICQRYIEMNPVRAGIVAHPGDYPWSSYRANAHGQSSDLLTCHRLYSCLGQTREERLAAYQALFDHELERDVIDTIRKATNGNFSLGTARFQSEIAEALGRRVAPGKAGRPPKQHVKKSSR